MKDICIHRLPCGRCDKFNISCDLTPEDIDIDLNQEVLIKPLTTECDHEWYPHYTFIVEDGCIADTYYCTICGETKTVKRQKD